MRSTLSAPSPSAVIVCPASASSSEAGRAVVFGSEALLILRLASATAALAISVSSPQTPAAAAPTACGTVASEPIADDVVTGYSCLAGHLPTTRTLVRAPALGQPCAASGAGDQERHCASDHPKLTPRRDRPFERSRRPAGPCPCSRARFCRLPGRSHSWRARAPREHSARRAGWSHLLTAVRRWST